MSKTPRTDAAIGAALDAFPDVYPIAHGTIERGYVAAADMAALEKECNELADALEAMVEEGGEGGRKSAYRAIDLYSKTTWDKARAALRKAGRLK